MDFETTYSRSYKGEQIKFKRVKKRSDQDVVKDPYNIYLTIPQCKFRAAKPSETADECLKKIEEKYPTVYKREFSSPFAHEHICEDLTDRYIRSLYTVDYSKNAPIVQRGKSNNMNEPIINLPEDWNYPDTTQRNCYRDPMLLRLDRSPRKNVLYTHDDHFILSEKLAEILMGKTGKSEYQVAIGALGERIITEAWHGEVPKCSSTNDS